MAQKLKDVFFQRPFFESLCEALSEVYPPFDADGFLVALYDDTWDSLELKQRMRHASETLRGFLPDDYREALALLLTIEDRFSSFDHMMLADVVERFGVDDYDASMPALEVLTRTSSEFAIRPFLDRYPERAMAQMLTWSQSAEEHVRRFASEGCRPRLPWAARVPALIAKPTPIWPILENLKDDPSEYVRRSVANNLNDIAKDHPDAVLDVAERWLAGPDIPSERKALVKHGLRTLLKRGDERALGLFGLADASGVRVTRLAVSPGQVAIGDSAQLAVELTVASDKPRLLRLEYEMHYARAKGRTGKKVFQICEVSVAPGKSLKLKRKLSFVDRSTRKHYPGPHRLVLVVNGKRLDEVDFELVL